MFFRRKNQAPVLDYVLPGTEGYVVDSKLNIRRVFVTGVNIDVRRNVLGALTVTYQYSFDPTASDIDSDLTNNFVHKTIQSAQLEKENRY